MAHLKKHKQKEEYIGRSCRYVGIPIDTCVYIYVHTNVGIDRGEIFVRDRKMEIQIRIQKKNQVNRGKYEKNTLVQREKERAIQRRERDEGQETFRE